MPRHCRPPPSRRLRLTLRCPASPQAPRRNTLDSKSRRRPHYLQSNYRLCGRPDDLPRPLNAPPPTDPARFPEAIALDPPIGHYLTLSPIGPPLSTYENPANSPCVLWLNTLSSTTLSSGASLRKSLSTLAVSTALSTLGRNGGVISLRPSFAQSRPWKKRCRLISSAPLAPRRWAGFFWRRPVRIRRASPVMVGGKVSVSEMTVRVSAAGQSSEAEESGVRSGLLTALVHLLVVFLEESRQAREHLIQQHPECPPVD